MKVVDEKNSLLQGFLRWRERHIKDKQFVLILSFLVESARRCPLVC